MSNSISPNSMRSSENGFSMITTNWLEEETSTKSSSNAMEESQSKFYWISENISGLYCSDKVDNSIQQQNIYTAISHVKKNKVDSHIKIFCLIKTNDVLSKFRDQSVMVSIDLSKPPQLMPMLKFCENLFDWLMKDESNIGVLYYNTDDNLLLTVTYAYSCYYDSMPRRDIRLSVEMKSFLNLHSKTLEKVPVSYRRYGGYMSLYSCMNQLQSYRSSVSLYCLILYDLPAMESDKAKTSQLFFKFYTNEPLKCSHTTKLYCLPSNVNRLVILFDQYPILLRNDVMIICYHRNLVGSRRTKILRLNFHTCQATSDMLTFYSQDFEDLYRGCQFKIKLDLYFQGTAVFGQGEANFTCETSHTQSSQLERFDSYTDLSIKQSDLIRSHSSYDHNKVVRTSSLIYQREMRDQSLEVKKEEKEIKMSTETEASYNNRQTVSSRDCHDSSKLEPVKNLEQPQKVDIIQRNLSVSKPVANSQPSKFVESFQNKNNIHVRNTENKETQMISELLEAQNEISHLRQSKKQFEQVNQLSDNVGDTTRLYNLTSHQQDNFELNSEKISTTTNVNQHFHNSKHSGDVFSINGGKIITSYSAHRENTDRVLTTNETMLSQNQSYNLKSSDVFEEIETINLQPIGKGIHDLKRGYGPSNSHLVRSPGGSFTAKHNSSTVSDHLWSRSTIAGKQYISKSNSNSKKFVSNNEVNSVTTLSAIFQNENKPNVTLQSVKDKEQWWYQPTISRDEAIVILRYCEQGSFLIRDSNTYVGAYGLTVKVVNISPKIISKSDDLESEKVRHYLIEPIGTQGVCFKGFSEEPIFPSLAHLVLFYTHTLSVLPCLLVLPTQQLSDNPRIMINSSTNNSIIMSSPRLESNFNVNQNAYSVYYIGCYNAEYFTGPSIINKAIERLLGNIDHRKVTECELRITSGDGIDLIDVERKLFIRRHHSFSDISFCGLDPRNRKIELEMCNLKGIKKSKLFGIIVKNAAAGERKCLLFAEMDSDQRVNTIVKDVCDNLKRPTST